MSSTRCSEDHSIKGVSLLFIQEQRSKKPPQNELPEPCLENDYLWDQVRLTYVKLKQYDSLLFYTFYTRLKSPFIEISRILTES